jgi:hypothetical protein
VGDDLPARFLLQPRQFLRRVPAGDPGRGVADWRLAENTTLGISFMGAAIGWSELGQNVAISS